MLDRTSAGHSNSATRPAGWARKLAAVIVAAMAALLLLTAPAHATPASEGLPAVAQETPAPTPAAPPTPPAQQTGTPSPQYDTQPPGVSAYLPAEALITILVITAVFILGLRYGATVAAAAIKTLLRLFQNTPPAP
ncbi:hypothetical protein ACISU4_05555 [Streptomyces wuyuanensis]|uniref:hypothetical protein n=1 Tax=Streptomyces wuyuanensis TaxID=1196353 RepID=UPI0038262605